LGVRVRLAVGAVFAFGVRRRGPAAGCASGFLMLIALVSKGADYGAKRRCSTTAAVAMAGWETESEFWRLSIDG